LTPLTPEEQEQLAALKKARATREAEEQAEAERLEFEELRLDEELAGKLGKRGKDYEILSTEFGVFALKRPDTKGLEAWRRATKDPDAITEDKLAMVLRHYIVPAERANDFHLATTERPEIATRMAHVFRALMGAKHLESKKKY
jgi:hypothetical protein